MASSAEIMGEESVEAAEFLFALVVWSAASLLREGATSVSLFDRTCAGPSSDETCDVNFLIVLGGANSVSLFDLICVGSSSESIDLLLRIPALIAF